MIMGFLWLIVLLFFFLNRCVVCADYHLCHNCFATNTHTQHSFQFRQVSQQWYSNLSCKTNTTLHVKLILYCQLPSSVSQPCQFCIATLPILYSNLAILYCNLTNSVLQPRQFFAVLLYLCTVANQVD